MTSSFHLSKNVFNKLKTKEIITKFVNLLTTALTMLEYKYMVERLYFRKKYKNILITFFTQ